MKARIQDSTYAGLDEYIDILKDYSFKGEKTYCCHNYVLTDGYIEVSSLDDLIALARRCNRSINVIPLNKDANGIDFIASLSEKINF